MRKRPDMKTTKKQIVDWGDRNIDECDYPVDASEMDTHCWRCGYERKTERAHIVHWAQSGYDPQYDAPKYYRLLCALCHEEAPNVNDEEEMDDWIKSSAKVYNEHYMYNVYWKVRDKITEIYNSTGRHGFNATNKSTEKWMLKEFQKWEKEEEDRMIEKYMKLCVDKGVEP